MRTLGDYLREIQIKFMMQRREYYTNHKNTIEIEVLDNVMIQKLKIYLTNHGCYVYNINNTLIITKYRG